MGAPKGHCRICVQRTQAVWLGFIGGENFLWSLFKVEFLRIWPKRYDEFAFITQVVEQRGLAGGGWSLLRTVLWTEFPANREKYREFREFGLTIWPLDASIPLNINKFLRN